MGAESASTRETQSEKKKKKHKKPKDPEPVQARIDVVSDQSGKALPLVGYFPSGFDPMKVPDGPDSTRVRVFRNSTKNKSNRVQLVVSPTGSQVDFVGSSYSGEATAGQMCRYSLGVFDKETQTLRVVPIAADKIFRLVPSVLGSYHADEEEPPVLDKGEVSVEQKAQKMRDLTNRYGTKKAITQAKKMQALYQTEDPNGQEIFDKEIKEGAINKEALESTEAHVTRNIPPYDTSATTPQEAYPLDKIIQKGDWPYLQDVLYERDRVLSNACPLFVRNRLHKLDEIQDNEERTTLASIFSYINHLLKFKDKHSMDGVSSAKDHMIPSILFMKFSSMFSISESKRLPVEKNDLLISYVLVLALHADGFRTDPADIAKDLRMSPVTLRSHLEILGCKLKSQNKIMYATLDAPLQFPILSRKRRRRG